MKLSRVSSLHAKSGADVCVVEVGKVPAEANNDHSIYVSRSFGAE